MIRPKKGGLIEEAGKALPEAKAGYGVQAMSNINKPPTDGDKAWTMVVTFAPTEQGTTLEKLWRVQALQRSSREQGI